MKNNPILIVDDDIDDLHMISEVMNTLDLPHPVIAFQNGDELKQYLLETEDTPFLTICDINLPRQDGFEVIDSLLSDPATRYKSVPFIFWSTSASEKQIQEAYDRHAQGFFFKPDSFRALEVTLRRIIEYWSESRRPVIDGH